MEVLEHMNIFKALFGIFRKGGLVASIKKGESLRGFALAALLTAILGSALYGFAMGIGLGLETAIRDAIKIGLIAIMVLIFSVPVFWISFRLLGREESMGHVNAVPLTMLATVTLILAISSPVVFLLSVLIISSSSAIYIHIIIINLAILVGIYITGMLIYHTFKEYRRLVTPAIISFAMMGVILIVGMMFFTPFLQPSKSFSEGTDRLKDGLGIDVDVKANQSLSSAIQAESLTYNYVRTNENGDTIQDYQVTRVGDNYLIEVDTHSVAGEGEQHDAMVWYLDGQFYTNFKGGAVDFTDSQELTSYTNASTPDLIFVLGNEFESARWRGYQQGNVYSAVATTPNLELATLIMDKDGRLSSMVIGSAEDAVHAETHITDIVQAELTQAELEDSLNNAILMGTFIGVEDKVKQNLATASAGNQLTYRYQTAYDNEDLIQDYSVTRVGNSYHIEVHLHAVPGETLREDQNIWIIDEIYYADFKDGVVYETNSEDLSSYLAGVLPDTALQLPSEFSGAVWQASQTSSLYDAVGVSQNGSQAHLEFDATSGRLSEYSISNTQTVVPAVTRVKNVSPINLDRTALENDLYQAIIVGEGSRSISSMATFVREDYYFFVRYPDTWRSNSWSSADLEIEFNQECAIDQDCADLKVSVLELVDDQTPSEAAEAFANNLRLQPEFKTIKVRKITMDGVEVSGVEYLFDEVESGKLISTKHIVYVFDGAFYRYHLDFNAPPADFSGLQDLFLEMVKLFTYFQVEE
jgi:hypothetical protein